MEDGEWGRGKKGKRIKEHKAQGKKKKAKGQGKIYV